MFASKTQAKEEIRIASTEYPENAYCMLLNTPAWRLHGTTLARFIETPGRPPQTYALSHDSLDTSLFLPFRGDGQRLRAASQRTALLCF